MKKKAASTLPEKIAELQKRVKELKKVSNESSKVPSNPRLNAGKALKECEAMSNNKENVFRFNAQYKETLISKEQSTKLGHILMSNTMGNVSEDSESERKISKKSWSEEESPGWEEMSKRQSGADFEAKLKETEEIAARQAAKISALTKRNVFLEARNVQKVRRYYNILIGAGKETVLWKHSEDNASLCRDERRFEKTIREQNTEDRINWRI